jgi:hypothetical protein
MATRLKPVEEAADPDTGELVATESQRPESEHSGEPLGDDVAEDTIDLAAETLSGDLRDAVLTMFKDRQKPWEKMSEGEKRDTAYAIEGMTRDLVGRACLILAAGGRLTATAELETFQQKGREIVAKLNLYASPEAVLALNKACGSSVQILFVDAAPFKGERAAVEIEPDQGDLLQEAGVVHSDPED